MSVYKFKEGVNSSRLNGLTLVRKDLHLCWGAMLECDVRSVGLGHQVQVCVVALSPARHAFSMAQPAGAHNNHVVLDDHCGGDLPHLQRFLVPQAFGSGGSTAGSSIVTGAGCTHSMRGQGKQQGPRPFVDMLAAVGALALSGNSWL